MEVFGPQGYFCSHLSHPWGDVGPRDPAMPSTAQPAQPGTAFLTICMSFHVIEKICCGSCCPHPAPSAKENQLWGQDGTSHPSQPLKSPQEHLSEAPLPHSPFQDTPGASTSVFFLISSSLSSQRRLWRVRTASCAWLEGSSWVRVSPKTFPKATMGSGKERGRARDVRATHTPTTLW